MEDKKKKIFFFSAVHTGDSPVCRAIALLCDCVCSVCYTASFVRGQVLGLLLKQWSLGKGPQDNCLRKGSIDLSTKDCVCGSGPLALKL